MGVSRRQTWVHEPALSSEAMDQHGLALPPQDLLAQMFDADARLRGHVRGVVHQDLVRLGELLEARRRGHRIAGEGNGAVARDFAQGRHHLARRDPDPQYHGLAVGGHVAGQAGLHLEGAQTGAQGIVVVGDRGSEDRQHGVADELLERSAEADDGLAEQRQRAVDPGSNLLRIQLVDQTGVADHVREERGNYSAIADAKPFGEAFEAAAAVVAEAGAGGSWSYRNRDKARETSCPNGTSLRGSNCIELDAAKSSGPKRPASGVRPRAVASGRVRATPQSTA